MLYETAHESASQERMLLSLSVSILIVPTLLTLQLAFPMVADTVSDVRFSMMVPSARIHATLKKYDFSASLSIYHSNLPSDFIIRPVFHVMTSFPKLSALSP